MAHYAENTEVPSGPLTRRNRENTRTLRREHLYVRLGCSAAR